MLFTENEQQIGIISAGCLETDLAIQAAELLGDNLLSSRTISYDLSSEDDLSWGRGAGCNGKVHVLLEKVDSVLKENLSIVKRHLMKGIPVVSIRILEKDYSVQKHGFMADEYHTFGNQHIITDSIIHAAFKGNKSRIHYMDDIGQHVFIQHFQPKPRLFIFGAGPDVRPFAAMAIQTGFSVSVWDWRSAYCNEMYFPGATLLKGVSIGGALGGINFVPSDSVVMMTHDFQKDKELLKHFLACKQIGYLGILGPRRRTSRLLDGKEIPEHLHSPVGLPIKADGPEEIAISIIAELIQSQHQLSLKEGLFRANSRYLSSSG
uniref:Xanthine dehydrogenase subunit A n=2 Tax=Virgibacillus oceani TaxID=1479511 RepID=A0A917HBX7_9BACI|nr:putative xanthine dehydrogenase subunit A [Virgibacillus oceani]